MTKYSLITNDDDNGRDGHEDDEDRDDDDALFFPSWQAFTWDRKEGITLMLLSQPRHWHTQHAM